MAEIYGYEEESYIFHSPQPVVKKRERQVTKTPQAEIKAVKQTKAPRLKISKQEGTLNPVICSALTYDQKMDKLLTTEGFDRKTGFMTMKFKNLQRKMKFGQKEKAAYQKAYLSMDEVKTKRRALVQSKVAKGQPVPRPTRKIPTMDTPEAQMTHDDLVKALKSKTWKKNRRYRIKFDKRKSDGTLALALLEAFGYSLADLMEQDLRKTMGKSKLLQRHDLLGFEADGNELKIRLKADFKKDFGEEVVEELYDDIQRVTGCNKEQLNVSEARDGSIILGVTLTIGAVCLAVGAVASAVEDYRNPNASLSENVALMRNLVTGASSSAPPVASAVVNALTPAVHGVATGATGIMTPTVFHASQAAAVGATGATATVTAAQLATVGVVAGATLAAGYLLHKYLAGTLRWSPPAAGGPPPPARALRPRRGDVRPEIGIREVGHELIMDVNFRCLACDRATTVRECNVNHRHHDGQLFYCEAYCERCARQQHRRLVNGQRVSCPECGLDAWSISAPAGQPPFQPPIPRPHENQGGWGCIIQ